LAALRSKDWIALALFLALCLGVGAVGSAIVQTSIATWYADLVKPSFNPPNEVFPVVWTVLYAMMAVAAWRIWRTADPETRRWPLTLFALQLAINLGWTVVFFGLQKIDSALAAIVVLDVGVTVTTLAFRTLDRAAARLMMPYLAWVLFATLLNVSIWRLNPTV
jgi:tryptophan-rich sensory protein